MSDFRPRQEEIEFALRAWAQLPDLLSYLGTQDVDDDTLRRILDEASRFAMQVLAPLDAVGDREGCNLQPDGEVRTPQGWLEAYQKHVAAGWNTVHHPAEYGGQDLPVPISVAVAEIFQAANTAFCLSLMPFAGVVQLLGRFGSAEQKHRYLAALVSGEWTATLAMTEAQAGTDLGAIRTSAIPDPDGAGYRIRGQKTLITYGEHGMSHNILHFLLARDPAGVAGVKGLSLYIVPKLSPRADGSFGRRNEVRCLGLERKIGIHGSPTATLEFGGDKGAWGELLGEPCKGVEQMFVVLNRARLNIGVFGLSSAERALQAALRYAAERVQGTGPDGRPSAIAAHPDVRRMLLGMQADVDAMRAVAYYAAGILERSRRDPHEPTRGRWQKRSDLLTPIVKAWVTEHAFQVASTGVQVAGGMGYMAETTASRCFRDARVHPIYEGTTGIQAMDLALRKVARDKGHSASELLLDLGSGIPGMLAQAGLSDIAGQVSAAVQALEASTAWVVDHATKEAPAVQAVSVHYLELWGVVLAALLLVRATAVDKNRADTARFFVRHRLVYAPALATIVQTGAPGILSGQLSPP